MCIKKILLIPFLIYILFSELYGQFYELQTKNITLIYLGKPHEFVIYHLARCSENSLNFHSDMFNYSPSEKITIFLQDFSDYQNAGASSIPNNFVRIDLSPASYIFETAPANERMNWTMSHELVHVVCTEQGTKTDKLFRLFLGGKVNPTEDHPISLFYSFLTNPRNLSPRWYHEGLAVFWETWMAGGLGRAQGAYDEMVFRSMVRDSSHIYDVIGLESEGTTKDFQVGVNSYLYGTRFVSYLAYIYGPDKVLEWAKRKEGSERYFASQFKHVFKLSLDETWSNWITWENEWQKDNLNSIHENPTTPFRSLSNRVAKY